MITYPITMLVLALGVFLNSQSDKPDSDLFLRPHTGGFSLRPVFDESTGKRVECLVRADSAGKKVHIRWTATAGKGFEGTIAMEAESVTYFPTALCRSHDEPRAFYVIGSNGIAPTLEMWTIDQSVSVEGLQVNGKASSSFTPPTIHRTQLTISETLSDICDMTVNPCPPPDGKGAEELWVMEYSTRHVYAVDFETGAVTLRLDASEVGQYRKIWINMHSVYGLCMIFSRAPTWINPIHAPSEPDNLIKYDSDLDGNFDGTFVMPFGGDGFSEHPIQTNGKWVELWPDYR